MEKLVIMKMGKRKIGKLVKKEILKIVKCINNKRQYPEK